MIRSRARLVAALAACLVVAACGDDDNPSDGATAADLARPLDAAPSSDGSAARDGGVPVDASAPADAGVTAEDALVPADATALPDGTQPQGDAAIALGYDTAIAYSRTRPAFTPSRTVVVTSQAQLQSAVTNLQAGDLVDCQGAFTVSGEFVISKLLSAPAVIDLKTGASAVRFVGPANQNLPALYIPNASNLRIYGGDFSTQGTGGAGILVDGASPLLMWGFYIHDAGGSGLAVFNVNAVDGADLQGEITSCGLNTAWDPHQEKGTGLHGAILADTSYTNVWQNNRLALWVHDQPTGAAVEIGENQAIAGYAGNVLYLKAERLTKVATSQVAGNALQLWGVAGLGLDVKYLEASDCQGRAVDGEGFYAAGAGSGVTVEYGRASNMCLNTAVAGTESGIAATEPWDTRWGITYRDVLPTP